MPTSKKFQALGRPAFVVDWGSVSRDSGRQIDWANVPEDYRLTPGQTVTTTGVVAAAATTMPVTALKYAVPAGTLLYFGEAGETVRVTTLAAAGATSLAIDAAPVQIESGDSAVIKGEGGKVLRAGTVMGDLADATASGGVTRRLRPRVATTNPAMCILATDASEDSDVDAMSGYGILTGGNFYENLLPDATGGPPAALPAAFKTELGARFAFFTYQDTTS